mgnify:CR=1 FL=1|jgi:Xaa-Pro aminopeptidase
MTQHQIFKDRIRNPIPTRELERRCKLVKKSMEDQNIDILIMQNDNQYLGGYVRYFTDIPAEQAYPVSVLFPVDDEIITITSSSAENPLPPAWAIRGIGKRLGAPYFRTMNYTNHYDVDLMVKVIRERKDKKVGLVGMGLINAALYNYLKENLPQVEFVDATDLVDKIKAVKSEDELVYIRKTIKMHDDFAAAVPFILHAGMYEYELRAEIKKFLINYGSEEQLVMLGSGPMGEATPHLHSFYQNRQIGEKDNVLIMVEANGPGGFYAEIIRTWCLGEPSQELLKAWEISRDIQRYAAGLLKPGVSPADVTVKVNEYMIGRGFPAEGRLFGHGQGYDLVERPAFVPKETMILKENMIVALHAPINNGKALGFCCDNYLITENGAELMQITPQKIVAL